MNIKAGEERLVVERDKPEEVTAAGLVIHASGREIPNTGTVVAVGPPSASEPGRMDAFGIGERVVFGRAAGSDFKIGDRDVVILHALDILAVIGEGVVVKERTEL
jgi:co-chaperonin GroES (HSP10)